MPECNYCDASFEAEGDYLEHLHADHDESELSRIDRRRVADHVGAEEDGEFPTGPVILAGVVLLTVVVLAYVMFFVNDGGGASGPAAASGDVGEVEKTPYGVGSVHEHGTITVTIDGQQLDFSQQQYQLAADPFHFENGNGQQWHKHAQDVTLEYAMSTLGIGVTDDSVTFDGTTYEAGQDNVTVTVNGNDVDPSSYVLQEGDSIRIVAEQSS
jgi:hypothetical protein